MTWPLIGIFVILSVAALKLGSALLLPIVISVFFTFLLGAPVRWLRRLHIKESIGAGVVVFGAVALLGFGVYQLAGPAADWLQRAPETMNQVERKLRKVTKPLQTIQQTAAKVDQATTTTPAPGATKDAPQKVEIARPSLAERAGGTGADFAGSIITVVFLTYFLLATGTLFRQKLAAVLPSRRERAKIEEALGEIESHMSRYLLMTTLINVIFGLVSWGFLALLDMPNAALWGAVAGVLNYIPYVGGVVTVILVGTAALVSFDTPDKALIIAGGFLVLHLLIGNLLTPALLGRRLPLNVVALFVGLVFWGWVWGVTGAVLAVPMTVMVQVICAHIDGLENVAVFLDS